MLCVFMVEGMSVGVNVMLSLLSVLLLSTHSSLLVGGSPFLLLYGVSPPVIQQGCYAGGIAPQIQSRQHGLYLWATEEMLCSMFVNATKGAEW